MYVAVLKAIAIGLYSWKGHGKGSPGPSAAQDVLPGGLKQEDGAAISDQLDHPKASRLLSGPALLEQPGTA